MAEFLALPAGQLLKLGKMHSTDRTRALDQLNDARLYQVVLIRGSILTG